MNDERLTICFHPWMLFSKNDDYEKIVSEIAQRGFNCIRLEDGAGLIWDSNGKIRDCVQIKNPFGKYAKRTSMRSIIDNGFLNIYQRLLNACRAAKEQNVKIILSSWYFLHTNWFCNEDDVKPLFELSTEEKISFFACELSKILDLLKENDLADVVAFAEIFNEFDGLPFAGEYNNDISDEKAYMLRDLHEKEIEKLKKKHPDILFAFDTWTPNVKKEIIPRNIDVFNFHFYYAWPVYFVFQKDIVKWSLEEPQIPDDTRYYLKDELVSVADVMKEMKSIRTGKDWPVRISLYASVDEKKEGELAKLLDKELTDNFKHYSRKFYTGIDKAIATHDEIVPNSRIVMGEGMTFCCSGSLPFERDSKAFWQLIDNQMKYLKEKNFWGTVIATTHAPEQFDPWEDCTKQYLQANRLFL